MPVQTHNTLRTKSAIFADKVVDPIKAKSVDALKFAANHTVLEPHVRRVEEKVINGLLPDGTRRGSFKHSLRPFAVEFAKDHDIRVRSSAIGGGLLLAAESGVIVLGAAAYIPALLGVAAGVSFLLAAAALYVTYAGVTGFISSAKAMKARIQNKPAPESGKGLINRITSIPLVKKIAEHPVTQKIANHPFRKKYIHGPSQRFKDGLMALVTLNGAATATLGVPVLMLATLAQGITLFSTAIALYMASMTLGAVVDLFSSIKVLKRVIQGKKMEYTSSQQSAASAQPAVALNAEAPALATATVKPEFTAAATPAAKAEAKPAPAPKFKPEELRP
jgi:hypothetical protein